MKVTNREGRVLSVVKTFKDKSGEFTVIVDTDDLENEAWQRGIDQAAEVF